MQWSETMPRILNFGAFALGGALLVGACAAPAGKGEYAERYGDAYRFNDARQVAYKTPEDRLLDLGKVFAAETDDTVTFAFNSSALDSTARSALNGQAAWLKAHPEVRMTVIGHTDLVGGEAYNDRLGLRRAQAVVRYLSRRGVSRSRLDAVESEGERSPVVETDNRERQNRRATTMVAGFQRNYIGSNLDGVFALRTFKDYQTKETIIETAQSEE